VSNPNLQKKGSVSFKINHADPDWSTNDKLYKFGPFGDNKSLDVLVLKHEDRSLEIRIVFEHFAHTVTGPMPPAPAGGLPIVLSWENSELTVWLNGVVAARAPLEPSKH